MGGLIGIHTMLVNINIMFSCYMTFHARPGSPALCFAAQNLIGLKMSACLRSSEGSCSVAQGYHTLCVDISFFSILSEIEIYLPSLSPSLY